MDKVYGIFSGAYSDWNVHGFLEDKDKAQKYCAIQNQGLDSYDSYYIIEIERMDVKVKDVKLNIIMMLLLDLILILKFIQWIMHLMIII
jgi:hypothetical protein